MSFNILGADHKKMIKLSWYLLFKNGTAAAISQEIRKLCSEILLQQSKIDERVQLLNDLEDMCGEIGDDGDRSFVYNQLFNHRDMALRLDADVVRYAGLTQEELKQEPFFNELISEEDEAAHFVGEVMRATGIFWLDARTVTLNRNGAEALHRRLLGKELNPREEQFTYKDYHIRVRSARSGSKRDLTVVDVTLDFLKRVLKLENSNDAP